MYIYVCMCIYIYIYTYNTSLLQRQECRPASARLQYSVQRQRGELQSLESVMQGPQKLPTLSLRAPIMLIAYSKLLRVQGLGFRIDSMLEIIMACRVGLFERLEFEGKDCVFDKMIRIGLQGVC